MIYAAGMWNALWELDSFALMMYTFVTVIGLAWMHIAFKGMR